MCVLLFDVFNGCSTSVKEINWLKYGKARNVKHLLLRKTDTLKVSIFLEIEFEEIH